MVAWNQQSTHGITGADVARNFHRHGAVIRSRFFSDNTGPILGAILAIGGIAICNPTTCHTSGNLLPVSGLIQDQGATAL